jgi:osmotically-inducible protein OsmY
MSFELSQATGKEDDMFRSYLAAVTVGAALMLAAAPAAAQTTGQRAPQPKAGAAQTNDTLEDRIERRLETSAQVRKYDVRVKVENGVVTLTGDVATAAQKAEAERLAKIDGVTRVDSQIKIDPDEDRSVAERVKKGLSRTGEAITDGWITTKVKWFFVGEDALEGSDINVDTRDRVVTLKGTVRSAAGRDRAVELATNTDGVRRVVNELVIK